MSGLSEGDLCPAEKYDKNNNEDTKSAEKIKHAS